MALPRGQQQAAVARPQLPQPIQGVRGREPVRRVEQRAAARHLPHVRGAPGGPLEVLPVGVVRLGEQHLGVGRGRMRHREQRLCKRAWFSGGPKVFMCMAGDAYALLGQLSGAVSLRWGMRKVDSHTHSVQEQQAWSMQEPVSRQVASVGMAETTTHAVYDTRGCWSRGAA